MPVSRGSMIRFQGETLRVLVGRGGYTHDKWRIRQENPKWHKRKLNSQQPWCEANDRTPKIRTLICHKTQTNKYLIKIPHNNLSRVVDHTHVAFLHHPVCVQKSFILLIFFRNHWKTKSRCSMFRPWAASTRSSRCEFKSIPQLVNWQQI